MSTLPAFTTTSPGLKPASAAGLFGWAVLTTSCFCAAVFTSWVTSPW